MAQPGGDEKEGKTIDGQSEVFGNYRCVFRSTDSLYIMMKNVKTKRTFSNTFSKQTLTEMDLKQPCDKVVNLLKEAKSSKKSELSFKIAFGDAENDKKVAFDKLQQDWSHGNALFIFVAIDHSYFHAEYVFKLLEQKRSETDILRDIIYDMQQEIDQLKNMKTRVGVGVVTWYTNKTGAGNVTMDGYHLAPTLKGMVTLADNKQQITIGIAGLYKVSSQIFFNNGGHGANGHYFYIQVNGTSVLKNQSSVGGGFRSMEIIVDLKQNDKITFNTNHIYATSKECNRFSVQKM